MSLHEFIEYNSLSQEQIKEIVEGRRSSDLMKNLAKSPSHSLAAEFADRGSAHLKGLGKDVRLELGPTFEWIFPPDSRSFKNLSEPLKEKILDGYSAVWFGLMMRVVENMLTERGFDLNDLIAWHNFLVTGSPMKKLRDDERFTYIGPEPDWNKIIELHRKDPTHAIFFEEEGIKYLPFGQFLETNGTLPVIRRKILPAYRNMAYELMGQSASPTTVAENMPVPIPERSLRQPTDKVDMDGLWVTFKSMWDKPESKIDH